MKVLEKPHWLLFSLVLEVPTKRWKSESQETEAQTQGLEASAGKPWGEIPTGCPRRDPPDPEGQKHPQVSGTKKTCRTSLQVQACMDRARNFFGRPESRRPGLLFTHVWSSCARDSPAIVAQHLHPTADMTRCALLPALDYDEEQVSLSFIPAPASILWAGHNVEAAWTGQGSATARRPALSGHFLSEPKAHSNSYRPQPQH